MRRVQYGVIGVGDRLDRKKVSKKGAKKKGADFDWASEISLLRSNNEKLLFAMSNIKGYDDGTIFL